jgi:Flp pilus assembly protein CpaB
MKPKTIILMVVAVVCGLGASYMTSRLLAERDDKPAEAPVIEKVTLLVAKKTVEMSTHLRNKPEDFFQPKQFTKDEAPKDALTEDDFPKLKNKFIKRTLRKGDHILPDDLMDNNFGLRNLPNGMRALGVPVNAAMSAAGFASLPGSHVDIIWTRRGGDKDTFSKVLLEDVVVLAADAQTNNETGGAVQASVVTLALHPEDAMKLTTAMDSGSLRLVVRNLEDKSSTSRMRVSLEDLTKDGSGKQTKVGDPQVAMGPEIAPEPEIKPTPVAPKAKDVEPPPPPPKLFKMTASIRNGPDVRLTYYWVNESGEVVGSPQDVDLPPIPAPAPKNEDKKSN